MTPAPSVDPFDPWGLAPGGPAPESRSAEEPPELLEARKAFEDAMAATLRQACYYELLRARLLERLVIELRRQRARRELLEASWGRWPVAAFLRAEAAGRWVGGVVRGAWRRCLVTRKNNSTLFTRR